MRKTVQFAKVHQNCPPLFSFVFNRLSLHTDILVEVLKKARSAHREDLGWAGRGLPRPVPPPYVSSLSDVRKGKLDWQLHMVSNERAVGWKVARMRRRTRTRREEDKHQATITNVVRRSVPCVRNHQASNKSASRMHPTNTMKDSHVKTIKGRAPAEKICERISTAILVELVEQGYVMVLCEVVAF